VATLSEIAANSFARWSDPHSYPVFFFSFCGLANHIDDSREPQGGDRRWTLGPCPHLIGVICYLARTFSSLKGRGMFLTIERGRSDLD
jgi:hypothetical protein